MEELIIISISFAQLYITIKGKQNQQLKKLLQIQLSRQPKKQLIPRRQFQSWKQQNNKINENNSNQKQHQSDEQKLSSNKKNVNQLKKQWAQWSCMLEASIISKNNKLVNKNHTEMQQLRKTSFIPRQSFGSQSFYVRKSLQSVKSRNSQQVINLDLKSPTKSQLPQSQQVIPSQVQLIEDIFLFGPSLPQIQSSQQRKFMTSHQLYYPQNKRDDFQIYGTYLFPNQLQVKHIRQKNHGVEVNKMIFKNNKKLDCNVFIFQSQQQNTAIKKGNKILDKVNPSKWLYALSIQFSDFLSVKNQKMSIIKANQTHSIINENSSERRYVQGQNAIRQQLQNRGSQCKKKSQQIQQYLFKSNFCLCVMTYYPFIRFLKDILIQVFDSVKLRRMNAYHKAQNSFKQIDIFFFIKQLKDQLQKFLKDSLKIVPQINKKYQIKLNEVNIKLDLQQKNLINQLIGDWGFKILKILDKQTLLDIFCYIMMQQSICFVSQDNNILTFVILLYVVVMTLPFGYPHPCVSVVFNDQLLQAPFTAVLGINKGTKWLEENLQFLTQNQQHKIIVNLNQDQVKLKWKKRPKTNKTQKLKKIFNNFYKKIQTSALPSIFKKKVQMISRQTSKQQNQQVGQFITQLNLFYQQQLLSHLPNPQIIYLIKQSFINNSLVKNNNSSINQNQLYDVVIEKIQRYMHESRRGKDCKDQFIENMISKQPFRIYLDKLYKMR